MSYYREEEVQSVTRKGPGGTDEIVSTHPAFGQISVSRTSGGKGVLYGSDFRHQHQITLRIGRSEHHRNLSHDWHFDREQLIEVSMSEAQWATLLSSMNMGGGVPCTLQRLGHEGVPAIANPTDRAKQFRAEIDEDVATVMKSLDDIDAMIDGLKLSKVKADELRSKIRSARMQMESSIPYVAEKFSEHMEETVEKAKVEFTGFVNGVLQHHGLEHLTGQVTTLSLPGVDD